MTTAGELSLQELIDALAAVPDQDRVLPVGFNRPHSYRGFYEQLAFEPALNVPVRDVLAAARSALGATFEGWKGGDYTMSGYTECWITERGHSGGAQISGLLLWLLLGADTSVIQDSVAETWPWATGRRKLDASD